MALDVETLLTGARQESHGILTPDALFLAVAARLAFRANLPGKPL